MILNRIVPFLGLLIGYSQAIDSFQYTLGAFNVGWSQDRGLVVEQDRRVLFSTVASEPFIKTACGDWSATEEEGNFRIVDNVEWVTSEQTLDTVVLSPDNRSLVLNGRLGYASEAAFKCSPVNYSFSFSTAASPTHLRFVLQTTPTGDGSIPTPIRAFLVWTADADESYHGFGEQYTYWNLRGRIVPILTSEQGVGRGLAPITELFNETKAGAGGNWHTTYSAMPFFVTSRMKAMLLENTEYCTFDLTRADRSELMVVNSPGEFRIVGRILSGTSPIEVISSLTEYTGRMKPLPEWLRNGGAIVGYEGGTDAVRDVWAKLNDAGVSLTGFWLQDWSGKRQDAFGSRLWWNWELDELWYPGWDDLLSDLSKEDIHVMTYINPFLSNSVQEKDHYNRNLFKEAAELGYLVRNSSGHPYIQISGSLTFSFGTVDLSNPSASKWFQQVISCNMLRVGEGCGSNGTNGSHGGSSVSALGWMSDFAEYLPFDAVMHTGTPASLHNLFPELWSQCNAEAVASSGMSDSVLFFSRSAALRSPTYTPMFWLGDQLVTYDEYDGLQSAMIGQLSGGLSGHALAHSDIGGFTMVDTTISGVPLKYVRTRDLLFRWIEMSAWSDAIFRTHLGNLPEQSVQIDTDANTLAFFAAFSKVHAAMSEYKNTCIQTATEAGVPLMRHPWLQFPHDPIASKLSTQFMLGDQIMVAPVFIADISVVQVYLPVSETGEHWVHWDGKQTFSGGDHYSVSAPPGSPAVFALQSFAATSAGWAKAAKEMTALKLVSK